MTAGVEVPGTNPDPRRPDRERPDSRRPAPGANRLLVVSCDPGIPLHGPSGSSAHLRGFISGAAELGFDVTVALPQLADHRGSFHQTSAAHLLTEPTSRRSSRRWLRELAEWQDGGRLASEVIRNYPPCSVIYERHSLFGNAGGAIAAVWRSQGHKVLHVLEVNAPLALERQAAGAISQRWIGKQLERRRLLAADRVVVVSSWLALWAIEQGVDPDRVKIVANGAPSEPVTGGRALTTRLGIEGLILGFVGSMKPWHGVGSLPAILDALPEAYALVTGVGPEEVPRHPRLIGLGHLIGRDLDAAIDATNVGVAPYSADAPPWFSPLKIAHWLAAGVPVVAPNLGDLPDQIGDLGEIVTTGDPGDWAAAIRAASRLPRAHRPRPWRSVVAQAIGDLGNRMPTTVPGG